MVMYFLPFVTSFIGIAILKRMYDYYLSLNTGGWDGLTEG